MEIDLSVGVWKSGDKIKLQHPDILTTTEATKLCLLLLEALGGPKYGDWVKMMENTAKEEEFALNHGNTKKAKPF